MKTAKRNVKGDSMKIDLYNMEHFGESRLPKLVCIKSFNYGKEKRILIKPEEIYKIATEIFRLDVMAEEYVYLFCVDSALSGIKGVFEVSHGTGSEAAVSSREILIRALLCGSCGIIIVHNHPSGDIMPGRRDISLAKEMLDACKLVGIPLLDHIIVGQGYYSLHEEFSFAWN